MSVLAGEPDLAVWEEGIGFSFLNLICGDAYGLALQILLISPKASAASEADAKKNR